MNIWAIYKGELYLFDLIFPCSQLLFKNLALLCGVYFNVYSFFFFFAAFKHSLRDLLMMDGSTKV